MIFNEKVRSTLAEQEKSIFTIKQIFEIFNVNTKFARDQIQKSLDALVKSGDMAFDERSEKYRFIKVTYVTGKIQGNARGFAFCIDETGENEDLFISIGHLHGAFHKDRVVVRKIVNSRDEGEVVEILERGLTQIVGKLDKKSSAFVIPDDRRFCKDIFVPLKKTMNAQNNQKVLVKITSYPNNEKNPEGEIIKVIGFQEEKGNDILSAAYQYGLDETFPQEVEYAASKISQTVEQGDLKGRKDFTDLKVFTIDGEDARDLDDAVCVTKNSDGTFRLGVHIADVSHYARAGSVIDTEAFERATSVYFPEKVFPMLPFQMSNGICSLNPRQLRLTMSCVMDVDKNGEVVNAEICEGFIKTVERMTYSDVTAIIENNETTKNRYSDIVPDIMLMKELAEVLIEKREKRGCIEFETKEVKFKMNDEGRVVDIVPCERTVSNKMIEEFMILANETVAEFVFRKEMPFIYRVHEKPDSEKLENLNLFLKSFGLGLNEDFDKIKSSTLQSVVKQSEGTAYQHIVSRVMLRSMQKAKYDPKNIGHFGLSSDCYCHFTSPIRRYPDLVVHRVLKMILHDEFNQKQIKAMTEFVGVASVQSSEREKIADEAERDVDDMKKAEFAKTLVGQDFVAIISGVTSFGIFAELPNTVEGLIKLERLPQDEYEFDDKHYALVGKQHRYALSQSVNIRVVNSDIDTRRIDFELTDML